MKYIQQCIHTYLHKKLIHVKMHNNIIYNTDTYTRESRFQPSKLIRKRSKINNFEIFYGKSLGIHNSSL